jgi:DNA-binding NtrC family response regulator
MLGDEVAEKLHEADSNSKIIMITGYSSFKDEMRNEKIGINEIVMKPIPPEDLVTMTKKALKKRK